MPALDPADPTFQADIATMLEGAEEVAAALKGEVAANPDDVDVAYQCRTAASVVNALQVMAAASTEEMVRQQRDYLATVVMDCAINGWYDINEPIADWMMASKKVDAVS